MKHVIVIETPDESSVGAYELGSLIRSHMAELEADLSSRKVEFFTRISEGVKSAHLAVKEMYNIPDTTVLEAKDMYSLAKRLAHGYARAPEATVTDQDIDVAYSAVCSLSQLYCPLYLISDVRYLRDNELSITRTRRKHGA